MQIDGSNERASEGMRPHLTEQDWIRFHALDTKAGQIERGEYDEHDAFDEPDGLVEWGKYLRSIMEEIGPDGSNMY